MVGGETLMNTQSRRRALVLFAHGARDLRWAVPFERLQQITQLAQPDITVCNAYLEFMSPDLPAAVEELAKKGCNDIIIVPVFLGQGGHVLKDLSTLIEQLQKAYPGLNLTKVDAVGEDAFVLEAIAQYCLRAIPLA
jgi:sirohydrochlorin cobaltochelatase